MMNFLFLISTLALTKLVQGSFQDTCNDFATKVSIPNVHVDFAEFIPAGTVLTLDDATCTPVPQNVTVDLCRVAMAVKTSNSSGITLEAWLPHNYSGRFLSAGNGGLSGCVQYEDLIYATSFGFAAVGANNGHNGTSGEPFFHHPEVLEDFAYRSIHTGVVVGKELTKLFYEQGFKKSYYLGCSTGGRQGFKSIQEFPDDFDGVVAGSPAINFVNLISWGARFLTITGNNASTQYLAPALWSTVHDEINRQCDGMDGALDGIIEDPDMCHPVPETMICTPSSNHSNCLTSAQAQGVRQILSPLYGLNGTLLYPRMQPGSELQAAEIYYTGLPFPYSQDWYRYVVLNDPNWDPATFSLIDASNALEQNPFDIETWDADLTPFQSRGGRLLTYHGLQDGIISSEISKLYYSRVSQDMSMSPNELDSFYRLFTISGMEHCGGGSGAYAIGNVATSYAGSEPEDNVLLAMVRWVEEGIPPETVRGAKLTNNGTVAYRRKHCRWPKRNTLKGGLSNYTDENSWECV